MSHTNTSKKNDITHISEDFVPYECNELTLNHLLPFRVPPVPVGLVPSPSVDPNPFPPLPPHPSGYFHTGGPSDPEGSPPSYVPSKYESGVESFINSGASTKSVSGKSINICLYKYIYIWETNGRSYWAYLTSVDRRSVSGFRWQGINWVMFGVDLKKIDSFICYRSNKNDLSVNMDINIDEKLLNYKREYTLNEVKEVYTKTLSILSIPQIKNDIFEEIIGILNDKNIYRLIPYTKSRSINYKINLEVIYPENISSINKQKLIKIVEETLENTMGVSTNRSINTDFISSFEEFDIIFNNILNSLQKFSNSITSEILKSFINSSLTNSISYRIVYEKLPSPWQNQY